MDKMLSMKPDRREAERTITIFVSYSRSDIVFTERLVSALEARGFECLLDKRNLPFGEKWKAELEGFIRKADTVVFVVSPRSATNSEWCQWELEQTAALSKRLIPVVIEAVPPAKLPPQIGEVQLLYFDQEDRFAANAETLVKVLRTNRQWILAHTRIGEQAHEWTVSGRRGDRLLRRSALRAAEEWQRTVPADAPEVSAAQQTFITASRKSQGKRNIVYGVVAASLTILFSTLLIGGSIIGATPEWESWWRVQLAHYRHRTTNSGDSAFQVVELQRQRLANIEKNVRSDLASAFDGLGDAIKGDVRAQMNAYEEARSKWRELSDRYTSNKELLDRSILADLRAGQFYLLVNRQKEATDLQQQAIARYDAFSKTAESSFNLKASIAQAALYVGEFQGRGQTPRPAQSAAYIGRALDLIAGLRKLEPENEALKILQAQGLAQEAFWLLKAGQAEDGEAMYARIARLVDEAVSVDTPYANSTRDMHKQWLRDTLAMRDALKQEVKRN